MRKPVGIIRVPLETFDLVPGIGRNLDGAIVDRLALLFQQVGCRPNNWEHHVEGLVDLRTYYVILTELKLSRQQFQETVTRRSKHPKVYLPPNSIVCLQGKHRLAAARRKYGKRYLWTVRIYYPTGDSDSLLDVQTQGFLHQTKLPDGEIYWLRRYHEFQSGRDSDPPWTQLSKSKIKHLDMLTQVIVDGGMTRHKHQGILNALDAVLSISALRDGMLLGNWHKILRLACPEAVIHYLHHIRQQWVAIAKEVPDFCLTSADVQKLEFLAPSIRDDRVKICRMMKERVIFREVDDDASREKILSNILSLEGIITSMTTFHKNMNYFEIAADVLRQYVQEDGEETRHPTLFHNLAAHWDHTRAYVEYKQGQYHRIAATNIKIAIVQLVLFALRHFPYLSSVQPLQDQRGVRAVVAETDDYFVFLLHKLASKLGFTTSKVRRGVKQEHASLRGRRYTVSEGYPRWRGGKPPMRAFLDLETESYLPTLLNVAKDQETPLFVQADLITAFFGRISYSLAEEISPISSSSPSDNDSWYTGAEGQSGSVPSTRQNSRPQSTRFSEPSTTFRSFSTPAQFHQGSDETKEKPSRLQNTDDQAGVRYPAMPLSYPVLPGTEAEVAYPVLSSISVEEAERWYRSSSPLAGNSKSDPTGKQISPTSDPIVHRRPKSPTPGPIVAGRPESPTSEPIVAGRPKSPSPDPITDGRPKSPTPGPIVDGRPKPPSPDPITDGRPKSPTPNRRKSTTSKPPTPPPPRRSTRTQRKTQNSSPTHSRHSLPPPPPPHRLRQGLNTQNNAQGFDPTRHRPAPPPPPAPYVSSPHSLSSYASSASYDSAIQSKPGLKKSYGKVKRPSAGEESPTKRLRRDFDLENQNTDDKGPPVGPPLPPDFSDDASRDGQAPFGEPTVPQTSNISSEEVSPHDIEAPSDQRHYYTKKRKISPGIESFEAATPQRGRNLTARRNIPHTSPPPPADTEPMDIDQNNLQGSSSVAQDTQPMEGDQHDPQGSDYAAEKYLDRQRGLWRQYFGQANPNPPALDAYLADQRNLFDGFRAHLPFSEDAGDLIDEDQPENEFLARQAMLFERLRNFHVTEPREGTGQPSETPSRASSCSSPDAPSVEGEDLFLKLQRELWAQYLSSSPVHSDSSTIDTVSSGWSARVQDPQQFRFVRLDSS